MLQHTRNNLISPISNRLYPFQTKDHKVFLSENQLNVLPSFFEAGDDTKPQRIHNENINLINLPNNSATYIPTIKFIFIP